MHLYRSGMPLELLSEFLGHQDPETTLLSAFADTEMKREAIKKASVNQPVIGNDITEKGICAVLSDGMGGLTDGRKVSEYTISESLAFFSRLILEEPVWQQMETFVRSMNQQVCEAYAKNGKPGAGATLILLLIHHDRAYWCTVGDSRLYLIRRKR